MAFNNESDLFLNILINGSESNYNPSHTKDLELYHSIFNLFPSADFKTVNEHNIFYQLGMANIKNSIEIQLGVKEDDDNLDTFKDLIVEKISLDDSKSSMNGSLRYRITSKHKQALSSKSSAKAWSNKVASEAVSDIISNYTSDPLIEETASPGWWLKPNNQSEESFLKLLKNRSLPANSKKSKMFMWFDLEGIFHFESLDSMLVKSPIISLDFVDPTVESLLPTDFTYRDNGLRIKSEDINTSFKEYVLGSESAGELVALDYPDIKLVNGDNSFSVQDLDTFTTEQTMLQGYRHLKLAEDYNKAIYINNHFNFPYRFSFITLNIPDAKPGTIINLVFPHHSKEVLADLSLSGNYLITAVKKREEGAKYINEIYVVGNSKLGKIEPVEPIAVTT